MTREEEIRARLEKATPGPWRAEGLGSEGYNIDARLSTETAPDVYDRLGFYGGIAQVRSGRGWEGLVANAQLIANAPSDIDYLLNALEVERSVSKDLLHRGQDIQQENQRLREAFEWIAALLEHREYADGDTLDQIDHKVSQALEGTE